MADDNSTKIDLDSLDETLVQEVVEINPDANPLEAPPPIDDGVHRVKLSIMDSGWQHSETKEDKSGNKRAFLKTRIMGVVLAEGTSNNNKRVFDNVNTLVFDGKCRMAYILISALQFDGKMTEAEAKEKVGKITNYVELSKAFAACLAGEPVVKVPTKWTAQRKLAGEGKGGSDKYETIKSGQRNFPPVNPKDPSKGFMHVIHDSKTDSDVAAQAVIQDYFPDK